MGAPQNQLVIKVWENNGVNCVEVSGQLICDEHGTHFMQESFAMPTAPAYAEAGLWTHFVTNVIAHRFEPKG